MASWDRFLPLGGDASRKCRGAVRGTWGKTGWDRVGCHMSNENNLVV